MFSEAKRELKELMDLIHQIAVFDATLAANRSIEPESSAREKRNHWELRSLDLQRKYELI